MSLQLKTNRTKKYFKVSAKRWYLVTHFHNKQLITNTLKKNKKDLETVINIQSYFFLCILSEQATRTVARNNIEYYIQPLQLFSHKIGYKQRVIFSHLIEQGFHF